MTPGFVDSLGARGRPHCTATNAPEPARLHDLSAGHVCIGFEPEDAWLANRLRALEALDSGTTTLVDQSHPQLPEDHSDGLVEGLVGSGIRGIFCYGTDRNLNYRPGDHPRASGPLAEVNGPFSVWHRRNASRVRAWCFSDEGERIRSGIACASSRPCWRSGACRRVLEAARSIRCASRSTCCSCTATTSATTSCR
jgi:5-methylthioadenosine/S-adenosylhomocysteine deaminase